jgi:histidinol-phosphate aminotransferase
MIRVMNQVRGIGNVNAPALEAAAAALGDRAHLARVVKETGQQRRDLADALHGMGLKVVPSVTNFLMVEFPHAHLTAAKAHAHLLNDGIVVRPLTDYGFADHLRIGVGTHDECAALIASLRGFLTSNE